MATHTVAAMTDREKLLDAWDHLSEESRALLSRFVDFLEQEEADREEQLLMQDPEYAQSIQEGMELFNKRDYANCPRLEEAFPDDL